MDSPEQARFRLFDSITSFLKTASQKQPLVLVLDDLHWADQPSLLLLQFVSRELGGARLLLVGTYRDMELSRQHPLAETLGELTRERLFQRVLLRGLSQQDVERFIEVATGVAPPQGLTQAVYTQTEGNPLFVTEVVRLLVQEGELSQERTGDRDSWTIRIPEDVREVIGRRLNRLSQRCNETLTIASVIGREFELGQLTPLVEDISEDRLLEVLEEALSARVIEELPQAVGHYQFTHALIQETQSEELTLTRRVRLHARIAETLEELYGDSAEAHAAELAHHFAQAESILGAEKLVLYSLLAGERALAAYAWEEALNHFQRGLSAKGVSPEATHSASDAETAALLFGLGRAQAATVDRRFQVQEALASLVRAFDYYAETRDIAKAVAVGEYPIRPVPGHHAGVSQLTSRALALVAPDSHGAGRLLSRYGRVVGIEQGDYEAAQEAFNRALEIAHREQDSSLEMRTLLGATVVDWWHTRWQECVENAFRLLELASHISDPYAVVSAHYYATHSLLTMGERDRTDYHEAAMLSQAEGLGNPYTLAQALLPPTNLARLSGNWQEARGFSDRSLAIWSYDPANLGTRVAIEYDVGDFAQGEVYLERLLDVMRQTPPGPVHPYAYPAMVIPLAARMTGVVDRLDVARAAAETVLSSSYGTPHVAMWANTGLALVTVLQNDVATAEEQYTALEAGRGTISSRMIVSDRLLGLLAQTISNLYQAAAHFEDALAFCRKAGYRPELAWTCCDYADTLLQRASTSSAPTDDRQKATSLLDEALAISSELGMRPLMERVLSRREILGA